MFSNLFGRRTVVINLGLRRVRKLSTSNRIVPGSAYAAASTAGIMANVVSSVDVIVIVIVIVVVYLCTSHVSEST